MLNCPLPGALLLLSQVPWALLHQHGAPCPHLWLGWAVGTPFWAQYSKSLYPIWQAHTVSQICTCTPRKHDILTPPFLSPTPLPPPLPMTVCSHLDVELETFNILFDPSLEMVAQHIWLLADCGDCMYRPLKQISLVLYRNPAVLVHVPWHILH